MPNVPNGSLSYPTRMTEYLSRSGCRLIVVIALVLLGSLGCQRADLASVQGRVTVNGTPLADGSLVFVPEAGTAGHELACEVHQGRFAVPRKERLKPGRYRVKVFDNSVRTFPWDDPEEYQQAESQGRLPKQLIPARYNEQTELVIDVAPGRQSFDFELVVPEYP